MFLAKKGAHTSLTAFTEANKYEANGVPNAKGNQLTVSAVSEGKVIVE